MTEFTFPARVRLADVAALWQHFARTKSAQALHVDAVSDCDSAAISMLLALCAQGHYIAPPGLSPRLAALAQIYEVQTLLQPQAL